MTERFMVDDAGTLIDMETRKHYDIVEEICPILNNLCEDIEKEKDQYNQLFEKYWDMKKKLNQISNVIYRYDNNKMEEL